MPYVANFGVLPAWIILWDIINAMFLSHHPPLCHIYALPAVIALFVTLHIRETMKKRIGMELLYGRLKDRIVDMGLPPGARVNYLTRCRISATVTQRRT
ncbi:MAG: hypothetical protein KA369_18465 [Spirochaetes bacterium]|nr:hypothetical protein [Spirochaetota bacterium]